MKNGWSALRMMLAWACLAVLTACKAYAPIPPIPAPAATTAQAAINAENGARLVESASFQEGESGPVTALAFTPDDTQLRAVYTRTPMLRHWRITDHKLLASYPIDRVGLGGAALDGAGRILVLSGEASDLAMGQNFLSGIPPAQVLGPYDGLYLIDAETGLSLDRFPRSIDTKNFNGAVVSLDGRKAATRSTENPGLKISFELKPAVIVYSIPANPSLPAADTFSAPAGQSDLVGDFALDAQGRLLAVFAGNDRFQLWDVESRQEWGSLELPKNRPGTQPDTQMKQVSISPTRQWLAAFGLDLTPPQSQQVTLWRLDGRRVQWQLQVNFKDLNTFAFNPAGTLLAAAADDGLHVWNTQNGAEVKSFPGPIAFGLAFSHNGSQLAWGDWTGTVHLAGLPNP